ncbi:hypothetical protein H7F33_05630 [Pedobacter sp. PAMC26386]|nr:hypothetical protein H7F33_05630 [Pedobacter sp. PAMC26386]
MIEQVASRVFKTPLKDFKTTNRSITVVRYLVYYLALRYGVKSIEIQNRYSKSRTNVFYGEGVATDLLSYNKDYQQKYSTIRITLDNVILNQKSCDLKQQKIS